MQQLQHIIFQNLLNEPRIKLTNRCFNLQLNDKISSLQVIIFSLLKQSNEKKQETRAHPICTMITLLIKNKSAYFAI